MEDLYNEVHEMGNRFENFAYVESHYTDKKAAELAKIATDAIRAYEEIIAGRLEKYESA